MSSPPSTPPAPEGAAATDRPASDARPTSSHSSSNDAATGSDVAAESSTAARERTDTAEHDRGGEHGGSHRSDGSFVSHASSTTNRRYVMTVVQQPKGSAEFGAAVLSRLPLSPPLIVQLQCFDLDGHVVDIDANLPFLFSHLTLLPSSDAAAGPASSTIHPAGTLDVVVDASAPNPQPMRMLYGTLVSSPHELVLHPAGEDEPKRGVFFVFPDVSVRMRGTYRLGVGLMRIAAPPGDQVNPPTHETLAFISTEDFVITPLSDYVAPGPTPLTSNLAEQGVQMFLGRHR